MKKVEISASSRSNSMRPRIPRVVFLFTGKIVRYPPLSDGKTAHTQLIGLYSPPR
jgi:hypothetical protein